MFLGPVCHFELVRAARRRSTYTLRFLFGLVLLGAIGVSFLILNETLWFWEAFGSRTYSIRQLAEFGQALFATLITTQGVLVVGLTPALVADAIADERHRKTLHALLTSRLTSPEVVVGKIGARLASLTVYLAVVLPISSLLTLFGGVDPEGLLWGYAAIFSSAYFLAGLAMVASVYSPRARSAVGLAYALAAVWMVVPVLVEGLLPSFVDVTRPAVDVLLAAFGWGWPATPVALLTDAGGFFGGRIDALRELVLRLIASHAIYGTLLIALASWQLRPAFRRHEGRSGRTRGGRAVRWRILPRPPIGNDPIYWREAFAHGGGLGRQVARVLLAAAVGLTVLGVLYWSWEAFLELWNNGYGSGNWSDYEKRMEFNVLIRVAATAIFGIWMLWLAGVTAASLTSEREQDTWTSLLATPLDGVEIVRGKMLGALRATGWLGGVVYGLWLVGLAAGSVHPFGLLLATALGVLFTGFVVALGTFCSSRAKSTWKAQASARAVLIAPHVCCLIPIPSILMAMGYSLISFGEARELMTASWWPQRFEFWTILFLLYVVGGLGLYAVSAALMARAVFAGFDTLADRPRRRAAWSARPIGAGTAAPAKSAFEDMA